MPMKKRYQVDCEVCKLKLGYANSREAMIVAKAHKQGQHQVI